MGDLCVENDFLGRSGCFYCINEVGHWDKLTARLSVSVKVSRASTTVLFA